MRQKKEVIEQFLNMLRLSGYGVSISRDILREVLLRVEEMEGWFLIGKPRYRDRETIKEQKSQRRDMLIQCSTGKPLFNDAWFENNM